jgi:hypothetical protein
MQDPTTDIGSYEAQNVEDLWNERFRSATMVPPNQAKSLQIGMS